MKRKRSMSGRSRARRRAVSNGFTLMELLIVMAIIAILSLMALASVSMYTRRANGLSAVNSLQKIVQAEMMYSESYPVNGFACKLDSLGGDQATGPAGPTNAQLIPNDLATGFKQGYVFTLTCTDKVTSNNVDRYNGYTITARPQTPGKTGDKGYCTDETGQIKYDPSGGVNCTQLLGQ